MTPGNKHEVAFLHLVANGVVDPLAEPGVAARIVVLRARLASRGAPNLDDLIDEAWMACTVAEDRAFLHGLIDGTGDLLGGSTFPTLEPMFTRYAEGSPMFRLVERAAESFSAAVSAAVCQVFAFEAIDAARRSARGEGFDG
ncbi:MAG: hypothetical protein EON54_17460 [Alcaligenaceae bacterium]|nr:MAG: hypothetical protein EON54_17460 [Alcaligenaceae bacterium]